MQYEIVFKMIGGVHVILAFNPNNNCSVSSALVLASLHLSVLKLCSFISCIFYSSWESLRRGRRVMQIWVEEVLESARRISTVGKVGCVGDLNDTKHPVKILETSERVTQDKKIKMCKMQWSDHTEKTSRWRLIQISLLASPAESRDEIPVRG